MAFGRCRCEVDGQCHLACALRTTQHNSVGQSLLANQLHKSLLYVVLSYDLLKHILQQSSYKSRLAISATESTAETV